MAESNKSTVLVTGAGGRTGVLVSTRYNTGTGVKYGADTAKFNRTRQGMETVGLLLSPLLQRVAWLLV